MSFPIAYPNLYDYDVYPKVVTTGAESCITIRPLGGRCPFVPGGEYPVTVKAISGGNPKDYPASGCYVNKTVICDADGCLRVKHTFESEQEYFIDISYTDGKGAAGKERFHVYCVNDDFKGLYPYIGDLHMHTTRSDGRQCPAVVCANYRRHGYDFMVVSDHRRYYPSLEAIRAYRDVPVGLSIVCGEEVHMPPVHGQTIAPHIVNFGGEYSINALVERDDVEPEAVKTENRSLNGSCPAIISKEEYENMISALADKTQVPDGVDPIVAAGIRWIFDEIRRAKGLAIYPHPTWISDTFHVPDALHRYIVESSMFDAFEVLGGENYFEQNGYQTVQYYEDMARGYHYPIVGSTDSHSSYPTNRNAYICSTIVFAKDKERKTLIDAVKSFRSVAVDTISTEFRLVGDMRLVRYGCFLLKNYFPIHDEYCYEEGRLMKQYVTGSDEEKAEAARLLVNLSGRTDALLKKYFAF